MLSSNFIQCILYHFLFLLSMIQYRYLCRIFEQKCSFDDVFSLFEVDQVNVKYVSRATQSCFFVNYVTNTNQIDKNRMQYQVLDNDRAKHVSNLVLCENKSNFHQQNPQWWCFLCPLPPFCFAQKIHCIWSGSYSVWNFAYAILQGFYFHEILHMQSFAKINPSRKFLNLQYIDPLYTYRE